jgi:uncharacterized protein
VDNAGVALRGAVRAAAAALGVLLLAACAEAGRPSTGASTASPGAVQRARLTPSSAAPTSTPALPPYAIDSLRARSYAGGRLHLGAVLATTARSTAYRVTWPSQGGTMTGVADVPHGAGPFPVAVVDHGYIPEALYRVGQDSDKYADAYAADGFLCLSPDYPGYAGSAPPEPDLAPIEAEAVADLDLIGALPSLPQADPRHVAVVGHSNGGGVAELVMVIDPRLSAAVLYAPVSTDMADNARKWWTRGLLRTGPLGSPDADPLAYALISPRNYLVAGGPPVLVMQGTLDEDIPAAWTAATVSALEAHGIRTRFVGFPGAHHNFVGADLERANRLAEDWMRGAEST